LPHPSAVDLESSTAEDESGSLGDLSAKDVWRAARARRRRLRAEIRRFTQKSRRRRIIWLSVLGALIVLVSGSAIAAYSPLFAVERINVVGAATIDAAQIQAALADQIGTPLALVSDSEVKAALMAYPLIESYALEAKPPHDLTVRIVERTPIGVIESDAGYTLVDAAGVALSTTPTVPEGQPILRVESGVESDAFESVGLVVRSLPADVRAALVEVSASTLDDVSLKLSSGLNVFWGSAERSVEKARALTSTMLANPSAGTIDVSSPDVVVAG
jgi:cell division protein FtsQ